MRWWLHQTLDASRDGLRPNESRLGIEAWRQRTAASTPPLCRYMIFGDRIKDEY